MDEVYVARLRDILKRLQELLNDVETPTVPPVPPVDPPVPPVDPPVPPVPPVGGLRMPQGPMALQPGDGRYISVADLKASNVKVLTIRVRPNELHPGANEWTYVRIDNSVKNAKTAGKKYKILLMSGPLPSFVKGEMVNGGPVPWNPEAMAYWKDCLNRIATRYNPDPDFVGVHVPGLTDSDTSEEKFLDPAWEKQPGYSDQKVVNAHLDLITYMTLQFPNVAIVYAIGANAARYMDDVIAGAAKVCKAGQFHIKNNAVKSTTPLDWQGNTVLINALKKHPGVRLSGEMVGSTLESPKQPGDAARTGSKNINDSVDRHHEVARLGGRLGKDTSLDIYPPDIKAVKSY
jgi:hypothetical protein